MESQNEKRRNEKLVYIAAAALYLGVYLWLSFQCLETFPFVHSDESWLAGLSRDMLMQKSLGVTESFFDAKPRVAHAMKSLFHLMQMGMIQGFGYSIGSVRLLSLLAGGLCLVAFCRCARQLGGRWFSLGLMVLLSLDIQFLYASHFARQEIWIALELLLCLAVLLRWEGKPGRRQAAMLALLAGFGVAVHPNSFLCAAVCGSVMGFTILMEILGNDRQAAKETAKSLAVYVLAAGAAAGVVIAASFCLNPHFLPDYFRYGAEEFELSPSAWGRLGELVSFFKSIYQKDVGTYYLPDVRLPMIGMALAGILSLFVSLVMGKDAQKGSSEWKWVNHSRVLLSGALGLFAGMAMIGRFNQTAILFFFLFGWLFVGQVLLLFERGGRTAGIAVLALGLLVGNTIQVQTQMPAQGEDYDSYLADIGSLVPADCPVIGNLNTEFYFDQGMLHDYRNLPYVQGNLAGYIEENRICFILYSEELDYLYEHRPYYNAIYGNAGFIKELKDYCLDCCEEAGTIENPGYGARVTSLRGDEKYGKVFIYRVKAAR